MRRERGREREMKKAALYRSPCTEAASVQQVQYHEWAVDHGTCVRSYLRRLLAF